MFYASTIRRLWHFFSSPDSVLRVSLQYFHKSVAEYIKLWLYNLSKIIENLFRRLTSMFSKSVYFIMFKMLVWIIGNQLSGTSGLLPTWVKPAPVTRKFPQMPASMATVCEEAPWDGLRACGWALTVSW